ncbi:ABC-type transport system ATP-binding protein (probable substrate branched-chain amino acids) [Natronomonas pharaonis DSM 2160]|uniref:ABC-type transport system ATP-binding protein (Probable substrate branched-chain amino acids) n=1 Tax=Natronomonas pharaonis (strain ATCC 35678 / DSM 2160 / CIP 103997 / JCM 8858 / NBRC 14720 / NCIMB 2260 / Gabara) TaxID=348780 RepID=A0A1U7ETF3_NATPD|nr:ABC transporter ATP-binding protein [Natronomonas pharaonis]CAI48175.1 ABC-type transport system ATP-binding protein (probable substrate branched-chain amino acids) [Natronomonas pharaonis DSM 2160]
MLEARNLVKEFGKLRATDDVSLQFGTESGEMVFIVGPNGAGKTTLINLLTGLLEPDEGSVVMHEQTDDGTVERDITEMRPDRRVKEGLVRSFQIVHLFEEMTVRENVRTAALSNHDKFTKVRSLDDEHEAVEADVDALLEQFRLEDVADEVAETLPHGDRKLLDVAISFALDPNYLLLDEPTSGVGAEEKEYVIETVVEASKEQNVSTVTIEHDMDIVRTYADRMVALVEGEVFREGPPTLLDTDDDLRQTLLGVSEDE